MIPRRAAASEFGGTAAGVFVTLFAVLITTQLIRLLGQAAGGKILSESVVALLAFGAIGYLPVLLTLTLYLSILLTFSRWYRDSEMVIWLASGLPLSAWLRPVLQFALPMVLVIAALSILLAPWALQRSDAYRSQMDQRDDVARVSPGAFKESGNADRVFFVENVAGEEGVVRNVFVSSRQNGRLGVIATAQGRTESAPNGDRFLVLENGRRYEGIPGSAEYRVMEFTRYAVRIEAGAGRGAEATPRTLPIWDLVASPSPANRAEILWRVGIPLVALNLSLLALPLAFVNPRGGRTNNLVFALLTFLIYSNLLSVSQAWVAQERIRFEVGVLGIHGVMFLATALLFLRRQYPLSFRWARWR